MATDPQLLALLTSIDASLKRLVEIAERRLPKSAPVDLDGPHGDPIVKQKPPRDWTGADMTGRRFSECPPEYLDLLAERLDYFAAQKDASVPEQARKQKFEMLDANRARGWAARIRAGYKPPTPAANIDGEEPRW